MTCALVILTTVVGFVAGVFARPWIDEQARQHDNRELPPDE